MGVAAHWDAVYAGGDETVSWHEDDPAPSLRRIVAVTPERDAPIVDAGGGSSPLAGRLLDVGYCDVTVLDLSQTALDLARRRLPAGDAARITWLAQDLLAWEPERRYAIWHDRAVLHFFTGDEDRRRYARVLERALAPGAHAILATFAPHGPDTCSRLPVRRSDADDLLALLGPGFVRVSADVEEHRTPSGASQPFTWLVARRDM
jgi:trans-aconitate methyltransferase